MKILLPYYTFNGFDLENTIIPGGMEKFIQLLYQQFPEIYFLKLDYELKGREVRTRILTEVHNYEPDLIVDMHIGGTHGTVLSSLAKSLDIPILFIVNNSPGPIWTRESVVHMQELLELRHSIYFVSSYLHSRWNALSLRVCNKELPFDGILRPAYLDKKETYLSDTKEYDIFTIGRCEKTPKNPFLVHELGKKYKLKSLVISNVLQNDYYEKNKDWSGNQTTLWNLHHSEIMELISRCKIFVSTCSTEAYGIAALEALSKGIPVMLNAPKGYHASQEISLKAYTVTFDRSSFKETYDSLSKKLSEKYSQDILDTTYAINNLETWKTNFTAAFTQTKQKYTPRGDNGIKWF